MAATSGSIRRCSTIIRLRPDRRDRPPPRDLAPFFSSSRWRGRAPPSPRRATASTRWSIRTGRTPPIPGTRLRIASNRTTTRLCQMVLETWTTFPESGLTVASRVWTRVRRRRRSSATVASPMDSRLCTWNETRSCPGRVATATTAPQGKPFFSFLFYRPKICLEQTSCRIERVRILVEIRSTGEARLNWILYVAII